MSAYPAAIISPHGKIFDGEVQSLIAPGEDGLLEILRGHTPIINLLKQGVVTIRQENQKMYFAIGAGILEVNDQHHVLLLVDFAVPAEDLADAITQGHVDHGEVFSKS